MFIFDKLIFKPKRSLGQNFLNSRYYLEKIASSCQVNNNSRVIEIGSGYGNLTRHLLNFDPLCLTIIEKDENLFNWLNENFTDSELKISFILGDALIINLDEIYNDHNGSEVILVGNLPYNISNQLITKILVNRKLFKKIIFLVQKEVAQRWVASPNFYKNKYSYLSLFVSYLCRTELLFEVPRSAFNPVPPVDGAVVSFEFKERFLEKSLEEKFFKFTKNCFRFRRKTLFNNLKGFFSNEKILKEKFIELNWSINSRPQDFGLNEYLDLFLQFNK